MPTPNHSQLARLFVFAFVLAIQMLVGGKHGGVVDSATVKLISSTRGHMEAGNYTHYYLSEKGNYKLVLQSLSGDCDLYVSDKHRLVTFDNYDWQSITYGEDEIYLSEDMKRPISIAVYAHPYYVKSTYVLHQYKIQLDQTQNNDFSEFSYSDFLNRDLSASDINKNTDHNTENFHSQHDMYAQHNQFNQHQHHQNTENGGDEKESHEKDTDGGDDDQEEDGGGGGSKSFFWNLFIHLLEIIAEVFL